MISEQHINHFSLNMLRMKKKKNGSSESYQPEKMKEIVDCEVRPCGMLVQKRNSNDGIITLPAPTIRVRVKYGPIYHDVHLSSQATFGELKKLLAGKTGLHPSDQKLIFRNRERKSAAFLDTAGVKDKSKIVLTEDLVAQAKRCIEMHRAAKTEHAVKSISEISIKVDKLASQVSELEKIAKEGGNVAEKEIFNVTELLMNELIRLDDIVADGDIKLQRKKQVHRVQQYVETLDVLKMKNTMHKPKRHDEHKEQNPSKTLPLLPPPGIVTTKWEVFDSLFSQKGESATTSATTTSAASTTSSSPTTTIRYDNWELF